MQFFVLSEKEPKTYSVHVGGRLIANPRNALALSIRKWQFIVDNLSAGVNIIGDGAIDTCALCWAYHSTGCFKCPVFKRTGEQYCRDTPFVQFVNLRHRRIRYKLPYAVKELEFLQSLVKTKKGPKTCPPRKSSNPRSRCTRSTTLPKEK